MAYSGVMNQAAGDESAGPAKEVANPEKLRLIEAMLGEIGAPSPATALNHQQQTAKAASKAITAQMMSKDCLAGDQRSGFASPKMTKRASGGATPSLVRGAPLTGKDKAAEKRYLGKGLNVPPADSPGPIYAAPSSFGPSIVMGAGMGPAAGVSFARAGRAADRSTSCTPGPNTYSAPTTIGRQHESALKTAPSAVIGTGPRSEGERKRSPLPPGPGPDSYHPDILRLPGSCTPTPVANGASFAGRQSGKQFISRAHVVDCVGAASPGPLTYNCAGMASNQGKFKSAPAFSFPTGPRDGAIATPIIAADDADASSADGSKSALSVARALAIARKETPGPGAYDVKTTLQDKRGASAVLSGRHSEKVWVSSAFPPCGGRSRPARCTRRPSRTASAT